MTRKSWIQIDGKLIPKEEFTGNNVRSEAPMIQGDIEPFVSPITNEVIRGRGHLRTHMKEHGVTNIGDYSGGYIERKAKERQQRAAGQDPASKQHRIESIRRAMEK
jgi:hypothetical protein